MQSGGNGWATQVSELFWTAGHFFGTDAFFFLARRPFFSPARYFFLCLWAVLFLARFSLRAGPSEASWKPGSRAGPPVTTGTREIVLVPADPSGNRSSGWGWGRFDVGRGASIAAVGYRAPAPSRAAACLSPLRCIAPPAGGQGFFLPFF